MANFRGIFKKGLRDVRGSIYFAGEWVCRSQSVNQKEGEGGLCFYVLHFTPYTHRLTEFTVESFNDGRT